MPHGDKRADYGPGAPLPPELDPRKGRPQKANRQISVGELKARTPVPPSRGKHRAHGKQDGPSAPAAEAAASAGPGDGWSGARQYSLSGAAREPDLLELEPEPVAAAGGSSRGPRRGTGQRGPWRRGTLLGGRVLIALLSVAALAGSGIAWATYRQFTQGIQHGAALPKLPKGKNDIDGKAQNILLLGNDSTAGASRAEITALGTTPDRTDSATDTMMIMHIPADGKKATIISFPRDSWVTIPGHGQDKINAAYIDGFNDAKSQGVKDLLSQQSAGIQLAALTLGNLTGLHIDHYVQVNLLGFYEISQAIGGVNLCLNEAQNKYTEGDPSHPNGYSGIDLKKGWNYNVEGTQALAFVRQRHGFPDGLGDIDRIKRQQYFLSAVFHKATSSSTLLDPTKLPRLLNAVKKSLITDPSLNILDFVQQFSKIAGGQISFGTPPWKFGTVGDQDVVLVDPSAVRAYVDKMVGAPVDTKLQAAKPVLPRQVGVTVLNQSNQNYAATNNAKTLSAAGFLATVGDTDQHTDQTVIEYPDGMQAQAKTLSQYVPGAELQQTAGVTKVTLVLGADGLQAKAAPATSTPKKSTTSTTPKPKPSPTPSGVTNAAQNSTSCID